MIKIGITCGFLYPDKNRNIYNAKTLSYVENETINFIAESGCIPIIIPDLQNEYLLPVLKELDAVVLHGGSDVAPESYGELPIGDWPGDKYRDQYELKIIDYAFKNNKPVLGICRGCQILNVYFGGTLYQDIPTQLNSSVAHSNHEKYDLNFHKLEFTEGSILKELYPGSEQKYVNSIHHQAVKKPGNELVPLCISPEDGIIEGFSYSGSNKGLYLGIQWHPEFNHNSPEKLLDAEVLLNYFLKSI